MIQPVYLVVEPGSDRVYVSTTYPESYVKRNEQTRIFEALVKLPGVHKVDGKLELEAKEITALPASDFLE